jgi:C4-dicarboxylate-specific signal transduction histidine kinase
MVHELNQPLNAVKVGNDVIKLMIRRGTPIDGKQIEAVTEEIGKQITRASQMIERFSEAGKLPGFDKETININSPVRATLAMLEHQLKLDSIQVAAHLGSDLPRVMAHHNRMIQVIYNLLTNSREAINLRQQHEGLTADRHIVIKTYRQKGRVCFSIKDTGIGIEENNLDRVFEPFFTTKETGKGKGLGLTICNEIIRDCDGNISIDSARDEKDNGTEVTISFPAIIKD